MTSNLKSVPPYQFFFFLILTQGYFLIDFRGEEEGKNGGGERDKDTNVR